MDQDFSQPDDLSARREAMRERLRLRADRVLEVVEEMADPKTFIEVERAARAIMATDKMIVQLFSAPKVVSFDARFGAVDYGERERFGLERLPVDRTRNAPIVTSSPYRLRRATSPAKAGEDNSVDAAIAASALSQHERFTEFFTGSSPLRIVVNNGSKGEDEVVEATNNSMTKPKPVTGRLTKRQKRRQRAFHHHAPNERHGAGLGP